MTKRYEPHGRRTIGDPAYPVEAVMSRLDSEQRYAEAQKALHRYCEREGVRPQDLPIGKVCELVLEYVRTGDC